MAPHRTATATATQAMTPDPNVKHGGIRQRSRTASD